MSKTHPMAPSKKRKILNFGLVAVLAIATGIFLGSWYSYSIVSSGVDYSQIDSSKLYDKPEDVISKILNIKNPTADQINNWVSLATAKGITPKNLTASENFVLAEFNLSRVNSFSAIGFGKVETIATQSVYSARLFDGNAYTFESISKGMLSVAEIAHMQKGATSIKTIKGENIKETSANWTGKETLYTLDDYVKISGNPISKVNPYIISKQTVLNESSIQIAEITQETGTHFKFTMPLDPVKSVVNYVKQVKMTSGLSDYPSFDNVNVTVTIDNNWNLVKTEIVENYRVTFSGLRPKCKGTLNTDYIINEPVTLPI